MRFCSLGSGSSGNSYIVSDDLTNIIVDCGFSLTEFENRLLFKKIKVSDIKAILLTHEHDDHSKGAFAFAEKYKIPIFITYGTYKMCQKKIKKSYKIDLNFIQPLKNFTFENMKIHPLPVPHDAREPVQFKFEINKKKLAIITDLGFGNNYLIESLQDVDALILESNHDLELLSKSKYPISLKKRIMSDFGHLSNDQSLAILKKINLKNLKWLGAAHLSSENNSPKLVQETWKSVFTKEINFIDPENGIQWVSL
jgi:phosphoribosyl 1,2-cyclic phosphodiesterase